MKKSVSIFLFLTLSISITHNSHSQETPGPSRSTEACLSCHTNIHPGLVGDWQQSRHHTSSLELALRKPRLQRRVSVISPPAGIDPSVSIGCFECHGLNTEKHNDAFQHYGYSIQVVVSPNDCAVCHPVEKEQYSESKKAYAHFNLKKNPVYTDLVETIIGIKRLEGGRIVTQASSDTVRGQTCYACHGTEVKIRGMKTVDTRFGPVSLPDLTGWPNQGVGRINPDGSRGACTACHPRHSMSIKTARSPETCGQCHLEPDVPAYNVYKESKHGNIYSSRHDGWNMEGVPWKPGADFTAPTCAVCHVSLLAGPAETILAERSHNFGSRLWIRIFGLPYSHPQPKSGKTFDIRNDDGLPLPVTFGGSPASRFVIDGDEQEKRKKKMTGVCSSCHGSSWVGGFFRAFHETVAEADTMVETATLLMEKRWKSGSADTASLFDEPLEKMWLKAWLFYANSVRYAAAMSGPDYATFKNGFWSLSDIIVNMEKER